MLAVFGRHKQLFLALASTIGLAVLGAGPVKAAAVTVSVDQAQIIKLPERVATIVLGNPLIADASLQSGGILIITGKSYGSTNLLALDRTGAVVLEKTVEVLGASGSGMVVVYKGVERETYSCAPDCEHRITLGDSSNYFKAALDQGGDRTGKAQSAAQAR